MAINDTVRITGAVEGLGELAWVIDAAFVSAKFTDRETLSVLLNLNEISAAHLKFFSNRSLA
jgi:hypothetical protein